MTKGHVLKICALPDYSKRNSTITESPSSTIGESGGHIPSHVFTIFSRLLLDVQPPIRELSLPPPGHKNTKKSNHRNISNSSDNAELPALQRKANQLFLPIETKLFRFPIS